VWTLFGNGKKMGGVQRKTLSNEEPGKKNHWGPNPGFETFPFSPEPGSPKEENFGQTKRG